MRFFTHEHLKLGKTIILSEKQKRHIHVLRMHTGDVIFLFNQRDGLWSGHLAHDNSVTLDKCIAMAHSKPDITLYFGLCKKRTTDFILEKGTEMGVTRFCPIVSDHSQHYVFNLTRAREILIAAAQQCERLYIPHVSNLLTLEQVLAECPSKIHVCLERIGLARSDTRITDILIGPEGGFSKKERCLIENRACHYIGLGDQILRTETAMMCALTLVLFQDGV